MVFNDIVTLSLILFIISQILKGFLSFKACIFLFLGLFLRNMEEKNCPISNSFCSILIQLFFSLFFWNPVNILGLAASRLFMYRKKLNTFSCHVFNLYWIYMSNWAYVLVITVGALLKSSKGILIHIMGSLCFNIFLFHALLCLILIFCESVDFHCTTTAERIH